MNSKGQSTVEFALTLMFLMGFVFFFYQLSLVFGFGNYAHYATFMSARAYLSAGPGKDDQLQRAADVISRTLKRGQSQASQDRFPFIAKGDAAWGSDQEVSGLRIKPPSQYQEDNQYFSWLQGVRYAFKSRVFLIPLAGAGRKSSGQDSVNTLRLISESWLLREPTVEECRQEMDRLKGVIDNGC